MPDAQMLAYDYDEEALGFEEPVAKPRRPRSGVERLGVAMVAVGVVALVAAVLGAPIGGGIPGLLLTFGLMGIGGLLWIVALRAGTPSGIRHDGNTFRGLQSRGVVGWGFAVLMTGFYVLLYWFPQPLERLVLLVDPVSRMLAGKPADRWFLYGFLYTMAVLVFGVRMYMKYRHSRYHLIRTTSVMAVQLGFAFLLPNLLKHAGQPEFYLSYFWPLKPDYLLPFDYVMGEGGIAGATWSGVAFGRFLILWAAVLSLIGTPVLTYFFGKRWYCSWVCGCGGLAETLGDPWRQLSDKSTKAWIVERWLIHSVLVSIVLFTAFLWINEATGRAILGNDGSELFWKTYGFLIVSMFAGVIGVGFYPILGSRVWCRFGCPMAAILGIFQRFFSRFRITTNGDQCMSCGNCSTYCEMGIDVRAYAQRGENIVRASCVGCGVCAAVCPRGVLKLENGAGHAGRYPGSGQPVQAFARALSDPGRPRIP